MKISTRHEEDVPHMIEQSIDARRQMLYCICNDEKGSMKSVKNLKTCLFNKVEGKVQSRKHKGYRKSGRNIHRDKSRETHEPVRGGFSRSLSFHQPFSLHRPYTWGTGKQRKQGQKKFQTPPLPRHSSLSF